MVNDMNWGDNNKSKDALNDAARTVEKKATDAASDIKDKGNDLSKNLRDEADDE